MKGLVKMNEPSKYDVNTRLKRFRALITELEIGQCEFSSLKDTRFYELWHEYCVEIYHARCTLDKLMKEVEEASDKRWYE
jgi:hypothetical protein